MVADIAVDHPSCSKQHAVIQCKQCCILVPPARPAYILDFRPTYQGEGRIRKHKRNRQVCSTPCITSGGKTSTFSRPFIIDLESTNGTRVNDEVIPVSRYYELKAGDGNYAFLSTAPIFSLILSNLVIKFGLSTREYVLLNDEAA